MLLQEFYDTTKSKAIKQMIELIEFHEEHSDYFRHNSCAFLPERGYYFRSIEVKDNAAVFAVFTLQGWEHNSTYSLDMAGGFDLEMTKMKEHIECTKQEWLEEDAKDLLERKEQYEQLKSEFE